MIYKNTICGIQFLMANIQALVIEFDIFGKLVYKGAIQ
jgi:hypothetical protein